MHATCMHLRHQLRLVSRKFNNLFPHNWTAEALKETITIAVDNLESELDESRKETYKICQFYLRWAIARGGSGPSMHITMSLLGRDKCLRRLGELAALLEDKFAGANKSG